MDNYDVQISQYFREVNLSAALIMIHPMTTQFTPTMFLIRYCLDLVKQPKLLSTFNVHKAVV